MKSPYGREAAVQAATAIRERVGGLRPAMALVLGSGLGGLAAEIQDSIVIPYREIPGFPGTTVAGHAGELIVGTLAGRAVVAFAGRFHLYEGHDVRLAGLPARVARELGASVFIVSNAAGAVRPTLAPGTLMLIVDHMNLMFRNPLVGAVEEGDERFPDMSDPYDRELQAIANRVADELGVRLEQGVYAGLLGPSYETKAEVRMLAKLGADAVGMSTVPEVLVARAIGLRVLGVSCITNVAGGAAHEPVTHAEVLANTMRASSQFQSLIRGVVAAL